jgi:phage terminase small subunit
MSEKKQSPAVKAAHKREIFIQEYLVDLNATRAAVVAGYAARGASVRGSNLLREPGVARAVAERLEARGKTRELDAAQVLADLRRLVDGCLTPVAVKDDEGRVVGFKPCNATGAARGLELLGRSLGLYVDRQENSNATSIQVTWSPPLPDEDEPEPDYGPLQIESKRPERDDDDAGDDGAPDPPKWSGPGRVVVV